MKVKSVISDFYYERTIVVFFKIWFVNFRPVVSVQFAHKAKVSEKQGMVNMEVHVCLIYK